MSDPQEALNTAIHAYIAQTAPNAIAGSWIMLCEITDLEDLNNGTTSYAMADHGNALTITGLLAIASHYNKTHWGNDEQD